VRRVVHLVGDEVGSVKLTAASMALITQLLHVHNGVLRCEVLDKNSDVTNTKNPNLPVTNQGWRSNIKQQNIRDEQKV